MRPYTETELKVILQDIENGQRQSDLDDRLLSSLFVHLGSPDGMLRDQLIYGTLCRWIIEDNVIPIEVLRDWFRISLDERLDQGIERASSDDVFTRAFTTLLLALIVHRDATDRFLSEADIDYALRRLKTYLARESDTRGYVQGKGWAHSIAHAADAMDELVSHPSVSNEHFLDVFDVLVATIMRSTVYTHDEDERLLQRLFTMMSRGLDVAAVESVVISLPSTLEKRKLEVTDEDYWQLVCNVKAWLKSFYIRLDIEEREPALQATIGDVLKRL